jgi:succinate-semialdehyde dehydrogenase/glutarate-semialdehyde dehydrogenase
MPYQTVNPFNGEVLRTFDQHTDQQMEQMLANADKTFREIWSKKPVRDRAKIIGKAASLMLEQKEKFAGLATLEMGSQKAAGRWSSAPQFLSTTPTTLKHFSRLVP